MPTYLDGEDVEPEVSLWEPLPEGEPLAAALPRKPLDVSAGAPTSERARGDGSLGEATRAAQDAASQRRFASEIGLAGETFANAFVPTKSSGFWQRQLAGADRPMAQLQAVQKQRSDAQDAALERMKREGEAKRTEVWSQQVAEQAKKLQRQAAEDEARRDPTHPSQVAGRERFRALMPDVAEAMGAAFDTATLDDLSSIVGLRAKAQAKQPDTLPRERFEQQKLSEEQRRKDAALERAARREDRALEREMRAADRASRVDQQLVTAGAKQKEAVTQVETFGQNILRNIGRIEEMVDSSGTFEATGPESKIMGALIKEIAVDSAKLADPGSVAREGEVALEQSKLWDPDSPRSALSLTNATAKTLLQDYRRRVKDRLQTAYTVRGLGERSTPLPASGGVAASAAQGATETPVGAVRMRFPDGSTKLIPADRVDEARKMGGVDG
jgi:hypothetical protein